MSSLRLLSITLAVLFSLFLAACGRSAEQTPTSLPTNTKEPDALIDIFVNAIEADQNGTSADDAAAAILIGTPTIVPTIGTEPTETPLSTSPIESIAESVSTDSSAAELAGIRSLSVGFSHACAVTASGGVRCWGENERGQLGDGTTNNSADPVEVTGLQTGIRSVDAGWGTTCAVTDEGGLLCWGANLARQGSDGKIAYDVRSTPFIVANMESDIQEVSVGFLHACVLTIEGGVKCWGFNDAGQVGNGETFNGMPQGGLESGTTEYVLGLESGVKTISVNFGYSCALDESEAVKCWGKIDSSMFRSRTPISLGLTPTEVPGMFNRAQMIDAGTGVFCALTTSGGVQCIGNNEFGQIGDGTSENRLIVRYVPGLINGYQEIGTGGSTTCAVTDEQGLMCWGINWEETSSAKDYRVINRSPVPVKDLGEGIASVEVGAGQVCAVTIDDTVKCWGRTFFGDEASARPIPTDILFDTETE